MVRKTDINGKLVQFAWWALTIIVFTLVVAIRIRQILFEVPQTKLVDSSAGWALNPRFIRHRNTATGYIYTCGLMAPPK